LGPFGFASSFSFVLLLLLLLVLILVLLLVLAFDAVGGASGTPSCAAGTAARASCSVKTQVLSRSL
jgi:hypothetical protein